MAGRKPDPGKRAQILRAATEVFSAREFHTVPVEDVAAAAGVGKGTLYLYFPTKEQLFYATILEALDVLLGELDAATAARQGEEGLRAFVGCLLGFFWRRRHLAVLMHRYEHKLREPEGVEWRARRAAMVAMARAIIAPAGGARRPARDTALVTEMLLALIRAAVLNHQDSDRPERAAELIVELFLNGVDGAHRRARGRTVRAGRTGMRRRVHLALLVVGALATACSFGGSTAEETPPAVELIQVRVTPVATATVERVADLVGSFFAYEEVTVATELGARIAWLGPDMGDEVQAGDVILRLDDAGIRAELREVEARLVKARADNARAQQLRHEGIMSHEEAEKTSTDTAVLEAQRDALKVKLDHTVIHSPLTGSVAARMVSVGEVVEYGNALYTIVQDDPLKFRTPIPERFAGFLHVGQEVRLGVAAYPDRVLIGKITRINPTADAANRSIVIEAELPNPEHLVKPGFFGSGKIVYDEHAPALVVPEAALTTFAGVTKVYVIKDGKAEERVVRTGVTLADKRQEIAEGVAEGEPVAVTNVDKLEHGAPIAIIDAEPVAQAGSDPAVSR